MSFVERSILQDGEDIESLKRELEELKKEYILKESECYALSQSITSLQNKIQNNEVKRDKVDYSIIDIMLMESESTINLSVLLIYNNNMGRLYNMKRKKLKELCLFICNNINNNIFIEDLGKYQICYKDSNNDWIIK